MTVHPRPLPHSPLPSAAPLAEVPGLAYYSVPQARVAKPQSTPSLSPVEAALEQHFGYYSAA